MITNFIKKIVNSNIWLYYKLKYLYYLLFRKFVPAKTVILSLWSKKVRYNIDLINPQTFNHKIQWLKLYYRNPLLKICSNKIWVREYVGSLIGREYLNELIAVYDNFDDINFDSLPQQFVIKCSHDSGSTKIVKDKRTISLKEFKSHFDFHMKIDYFHMSKEWGYKNTERKIIIEKLIISESDNELKDYKVFCFWGEPKLIQVDIDRHSSHKRNIYNTNWNYINLSILYPTEPSKIEPKPKLLNKMLELSSILSKPFPHVRVDWYIVGERLIFGEMTFYHGGGYEPFSDFEWELKMGEWIDITKIPKEHLAKDDRTPS